jgi:hypothetical protein
VTVAVPVSDRREVEYSIVVLIMQGFRGDDKIFQHAKQLFSKYFPDLLDVKMILEEMEDNYMRSEYLIRWISDPKFHPRELLPLKRTAETRFKGTRRQIMDACELYGQELFEQISEKDLPWSGMGTDLGAMLSCELRKRALFALARLLYILRGQIGDASRFSSYVPQIKQHYAGLIQGSRLKIEEERSIVQAMFGAAFAPEGYPFQDLVAYIGLGMDVAGLHFASELNPAFAVARSQAVHRWLEAQTSERVGALRGWMEEAMKGSAQRGLSLLPTTPYAMEKLYGNLLPTALFEVPSDYWKIALGPKDMLPSSILSGQVVLSPIKPSKLPLFPKFKITPIEGIFGPQGSGKSVLGSALDVMRVKKGYVVIQLAMKRQQAILCCLPLLPICAQAKRDHEYLTNKLRIESQAMPSRFLTVCEGEDQLPDTIWTIHDRIIVVSSLENFRLDWNRILSDFPQGHLVLRPLRDKADTNTMRAALIGDFFRWREENRGPRIAVRADELQDILPSTVGSSSESAVQTSFSSVVGDVRGLNLPLTFGAIRPGWLQPEIFEMCTSIFFSQLRESGAEASRSSKGRIMEVVSSFLTDQDKQYLPTVERIMENRSLTDFKLFFWLARGRPIRLVTACLPPHMSEVTNVNYRPLFVRAEKRLGQKILVELGEVPRLQGLKPQPKSEITLIER